MGLGQYPCCLATSHILRWSSGRAAEGLSVFNTRETVEMETPTSAAISLRDMDTTSLFF